METIVLATLDNSMQANALHSALSDEGIVAFIRNETLSTVLPISEFQIEVVVFEKDYERSLEIYKKGFPFM
jgi:hypothetical protein